MQRPIPLTRITRSIKFASPLAGTLAFALVAGLLLAPARCADAQIADNPTAADAPDVSTDHDAATVLDRVEVTGSRIRRAELAGALPVATISRTDIEFSGQVSVADLLRQTSFNAFGSPRPSSGNTAQSFAGLSLRGLGFERTLILIDGRRAPDAPFVGMGQDLNTIPLAAVERIEILSDGASAIYGTDAIAGVVNIITRREFDGAVLSAGAGRPEAVGGDTEEGSVIFGASSERARLLAGASYHNRGIFFDQDREFSRGGSSTFANNLLRAVPAPGTTYGFVPGGFVAHPEFGSRLPGFDCTTEGFFESGSGAGARCLYDFTVSSAAEAELRQQAAFARASYRINDVWNAYLHTSVVRAESFGRFAPVPSSPWPGGLPFLAPGSPNHPAVRFPDAGYDPEQPYFVRHRFAALGPRDTITENNVYHLQLGWEAWLDPWNLDFGLRSTESKGYSLGSNYVVGGLAQAAITDGRYDLYAPFDVPESIRDGLVARINRDTLFAIEEAYFNLSRDLFETDAGLSTLLIGAEHRAEDYYDLFDSLQEAGGIVGAAGNSSAGSRKVDALYAELLWPLPGAVELNLAARHDRYSDYGRETSPKVSLRWQARDDLALRASWGRGFRAPSLGQIGRQTTFSAVGVVDPATCTAIGQPPDCLTQVNGYYLANPALDSEQSRQLSAGVVWNVGDAFTLSLDYFDIEIRDRIEELDPTTLLLCLAGGTPCPRGVGPLPPNVQPPVPDAGLGAARDPVTGAIQFMQLGLSNRGTLQTRGLDLSLQFERELGRFGALQSALQLSHVLEYRFDTDRDLVDDPSRPQRRAQLATRWHHGDFSAGWNINYVADAKSFGRLFLGAVAAAAAGYPQRLPSWVTHDLQFNWSTTWGGTLTLGVDNAADRGPVIDPFFGSLYDFALYDAWGRTPYLRYTQAF